MSGSVGSLVVQLGLDAADFVDGLSKADLQAKKLEASAAKMAAGIDRQVAALQRQADLLGKSAGQAKLLELAQKGATQAQLGMAAAAVRQIDAFNAQQDGIRKSAESLHEFSFQSASAKRELLVLAHELSQGNFKQFGGSLLVLAENTGAAGALFNPLTLGIVAAGAALATFGGLAVAGAHQIDELNKSLLLTNGYAGVTANSFKAASEQIAASAHSGIGSAIDSLQSVAKSGAFGGDLFNVAAEAATRLSALTGESADSIVADFVKMQAGVASYAAEHVKSNHLISAAQYEQIKALEDAGQSEQAQGTYLQALNDKLREHDTAISSVGKAWDTIKHAAEGYIQSVKNIGQSSVSRQLEIAQERLADLQKADGSRGFTAPNVPSSGKFDAAIKDQQAIVDALKNSMHLADQVAAAQTRSDKEQAAAIAGSQIVSSIHEQIDKRAALTKEIDKYTRAVEAMKRVQDPATPSAAQQASDLAGIRAKYADRAPAKGPVDDPTHKLLDNQLKAIEAGMKQQEDALAAAGRANDRLFDQNLESIADYYAKQQALADQALQVEVAGYDREIALLKAHQAAASKATDKADDQGKVDALNEKRSLAEQKAAEATQLRVDKQSKSYEDLQKAVSGVNVQVLEMQGHMAEAAAIKFDQSNKSLKALFSADGNTDALQQLDTLRQFTVAKAQFDQQAQESARVQADLQLAEDRISIAQQLGTQGELTGLMALGQARQDAVAKMQAYVAAQEAAAAASANPALIQNAEQARVALEKLQATANPLADKLNNVFESSFGNAFADFITGSKTATEAFQSFARSVVSDLANIAAQSLAKSIFGTGASSSGGIGGWLASLFAGSSSAGSASVISSTIGTGVGGTTPYLYGLARMATGTDYVPRDNFPALLHKGEAVVPAAYNKTANRLGTSEPNWTIVNQTTGSIDKVTTMRVSAEDRALILQENRRAIAADHNDPNSQISAAMRRNYKAERRR